MATSPEVAIKISADAEQARQRLGDVVASIERVGKSAKGETKAGLDLVAQALRDVQAGGVKSADALVGVAGSAKQLQTGATVAARLADEFERAARSAQGSLKTNLQEAAAQLRAMAQGGEQAGARLDAMGSSSRALASAVKSVGRALVAAFSVREFVQAVATMEQLQAGMQAVSGSAQQAGRDMDFVRAVAGRIGTDVTDAGRAFLGLAAATRGTAVEGEPTRAVFEAVASAMGKAGKSSAETGNALMALSQMASKGVVQSEELRGQLGEALPGALQAAANGLGITTAELMRLVEEGKVTAEDLFPALAQGLNELYGGAPQAQTLAQEFANVRNAFTEMADDIGKNGGLSALKVGAEVAQTAIVLLGDALVTTGKTIGVVMGAIATLDFSGVKQAFAEIEAESRDKLLKAAQHNGVLRDYIGLVGNEATKTALAQQQAAQATAAAGTAAAKAGDDWIRLNNGYSQVLKSVREQTAEAEKSAIARAAEGKAAVALATAFGTEADKRAAQVSAAQAQADALRQVAQLRLQELETLKAQLARLQEEAQQQQAIWGQVSAERAKQMDELQQLIGLRQQDADKATAQAQASRLATEQARAEAEAHKDNSARVGELRAAWQEASAALEALRTAQQEGKASSDELAEAELAAGKAALLYRDALQDQQRAIEARARTQRADLDLQAAGVQLAIAQERTIMDVARARGDEAGAMRAQERIRRLEIELLELSAQARRAEADAALAAAQAKKAELVAAGEYTGVKKLEIDAALKAAEVKRMEGEIALETANRLRQLGDAQSDLKNKTNDATDALERQVGALEKVKRLSSSGEELGDGVTEVGSGGRHYRNRDGMTSDASGNVQTQGRWTRASIIEYLTQAGLEAPVAEELAKQFVKADGTVPYMASEAQKYWGGRYSTLSGALGKMVDYYKYGDGKSELAGMRARLVEGPERARAAAPAAAAAAPAAASQGSATYVSNITLDGRQTSVRFADSQSQSAVTDLLRQLADARGAAA